MNIPEKFKARMKNMLGAQYGLFIDAMENSPVFNGIRINPLKENAREAVFKEFGDLENVPWCKNGFYADKAVISGKHPYHIAGLFYFQEPSAMSAVSAIPIEKDDYILDLCAAPGGKTTQAGAMLGENGLIVANEIIKSRAGILSGNIERFGIKNAIVTNETPQRLAEKYPRFFNKIIIDAPCSGEGMFRKEPQAAEEWSEEHTFSCGLRQRRIIDCAVKMLKSGGYLVYSTCTFAPCENEEICGYILDNYNMRLIEPDNLSMLSHGRTEWSGGKYDMDKTRRIFPHLNKGEGHFIAVFQNTDNEKNIILKKQPPLKCVGEPLYREFEKKFLNAELDGEFYLFGENLYLKPKNIDIDKIKVLRAGLFLGICRKNRFEPSHALCLSLKRHDFKNYINFDCKSAKLKKYLAGETLQCDKNGWCAVIADDYPIGWGKASDGILKNHFPKYLRQYN